MTPSGDTDDDQGIRRYSVAYLRNEQDSDLKALGVAFDNFYLESSLYTDGRVERAVEAIKKAGYTYEADGALWLRTTDPAFAYFKDDKDRVMKKKDGHYTYFVPDVAYHLAKFERGFTRAINIQGSDPRHHGPRPHRAAGRLEDDGRHHSRHLPRIPPAQDAPRNEGRRGSEDE